MNRGYFVLALDEPKFSENVGGVLRAAGCYGAAMVVVSKARYSGSAEDTQKAYRHLPLIQVNDLALAVPKACTCVAVEMVDGAQPLQEYVHPERAFYIFGGEGRTLTEPTLGMCRDKVFIPTRHCMNLAACVNVVLYDRLTKK